MRTIGLVVPNLAEGGGISSVAAFLARAIDRSREFRCRIVSLATSSRDKTSVRLRSPSTWTMGPQVVEFTWLGRKCYHVGAELVEFEFQRFRTRAALTSILRQCDIIQVVAGSPAWALVARDFKGPRLLQVATLAAVERSAGRRKPVSPIDVWRRSMTVFTNRLDRMGAAAVDLVFVENEWMRTTLSKWNDPSRVHIAPPGVDTNLFSPDPNASSLRRENDYILAVGRFADPRKNVDLLIEAYGSLRRRVPECPTLVVAGRSMPAARTMKGVERRGLSKVIDFRRGLSKDELASLYRNAALFVLPSSEEGFGMVLLEAMASGIPVIATATEGARQLVDPGATGFLVPIGDARALAGAMETLLLDHTLSLRLGNCARKLVEERYSERRAAEPFLRAYRRFSNGVG